MDKAAIIIQARLTSSRFPNKVFAVLKNKPVIEWVIDSCEKLGLPVIFAIPNTRPNDELYHWLQSRGYEVFRGLENDVLDRFMKCALKYEVKTIIRVCADTPLINDVDILDNLTKFDIEKGKRMIYGNGSWVFSFDMLFNAWKTQLHAASRENVVRSMFNSIDYEDDISRVEKLCKA